MNSFLKKTFCFLLVSCLCVFAASLFLNVNASTIQFDLSTNSYDSASTSTITWSTTDVNITNTKGSGTNVNNYIPTTRTSTRFYNGNVLTITPAAGVTISTVVFTATSEGYATALKNSTWTNATSAASTTTVTITATDGTSAITANITGTCGFTRIVVNYTGASAQPNVIVNGDVNVKLGTNPTYTATPNNISAPYTTSFATSNDSVATITDAGVLTPVAIGNVNVTATVNGTTSSNYAVRVWPAEPTNISEAIDICTLTGTTATPIDYTVSGIIKTIVTPYSDNMITVDIEDETGEIQCYKMAGGSDLTVGDYITVTGKLKKYSSTNEFDAGATYVKTNDHYFVNFNSQGGSPVTGMIVEAGSKINAPANPTKAGSTFMGWYTEANCINAWNFELNVVTANTTLYAKWEFPATSEFSLLQTKATLKFDYNRIVSGSRYVYELYTGALTEGDYIIYYSGKAMNTTVTNNRLQYAEVTPVNDIIDTENTAIIWHIAQSGDYWTIYNAAENKYAASTGAANKSQMLADGTDDKALWTVTGTSTYEFVNKANAAAKVNANLRNNTTYGFATYATGTGGALTLYKKTSVNTYTYEINHDAGDKNILSLQFRGIITSELKNSLEQNATEVKYGVLYGKTSDIETEFGGMNGLLTDFLNDGYWINEIEDLAPGKLRYTVIEANSLQGVDATGTVEDNDNPEYYQFGVSINKISNANINTSITVAAYAYIDGTYYIMQVASYSVKTLASEYVNAQDTSEYTEHLGALGYLASYGD